VDVFLLRESNLVSIPNHHGTLRQLEKLPAIHEDAVDRQIGSGRLKSGLDRSLALQSRASSLDSSALESQATADASDLRKLTIVREIGERNGASHRSRSVSLSVEKPVASAVLLTQYQTPISRTVLTIKA
jgi:hypothetical protein